MRSPLRGRYENNLRTAVDSLRTLDTADEDQAWGLTADALAWLYRAEQVERREPGYYGDRAATVPGQTLGGLLWYRGSVEHEGAEVRARGLVLVLTQTRVDGTWRELKMRVRTPDGWRKVEVRASAWTWPRVEDTERDSRGYGRDAWYREHVQGKTVLRPVEAAASFLLDR